MMPIHLASTWSSRSKAYHFAENGDDPLVYVSARHGARIIPKCPLPFGLGGDMIMEFSGI